MAIEIDGQPYEEKGTLSCSKGTGDKEESFQIQVSRRPTVPSAGC
jgi:hypothetical protein